MCLFRQDKGSVPGTPPVAPIVNQDTGLPETRPTTDADKVASVQYGSTKKDSSAAAANKLGTDALKINLNESESGSTTGGINV